MTWNFHGYYTNRSEGLISKLTLKSAQSEALKSLRKCVRVRIKEVFEEAKELVRASYNSSLNFEELKAKVQNTKIKYLNSEAQSEVIQLLQGMDEVTRQEFVGLTPRFWTQGSFQYETLNNPHKFPPQEMDIDDGTYLPMTIFENEPRIGHRILLLLVDSSLKSLVAENDGWLFEEKNTCARIKIPSAHTHIDVPMYAIPVQQFLQKQVALEALRKKSFESYDQFADTWISNSAMYEVDSECVNLAMRNGEKRWINSDPKIIEDWFNESCRRIGRHLRKVCRFMKAWRDAQWDKGGPSSIALMAATVNILDRFTHDKSDLGATMRLLAERLPEEFAHGVESPDHTDEKLLFPNSSEHGERELEVINKLYQLKKILVDAEVAESKELALQTMSLAFGDRVTNSDLIVKKQSAAAFAHEPSSSSDAKKISTTMSSG
ncbi:CBASS cGAMP synthase [Alteromonas abrolhosensis]|uniref:CBASS cGAMP synthase n=1 Tax=Alteromonas abrolhosensis TaxID=1892904 RepID=UPI00096B8A13|nr:hypothetical protein [Alteromonas abrolhosensis]